MLSGRADDAGCGALWCVALGCAQSRTGDAGDEADAGEDDDEAAQERPADWLAEEDGVPEDAELLQLRGSQLGESGKHRAGQSGDDAEGCGAEQRLHDTAPENEERHRGRGQDGELPALV